MKKIERLFKKLESYIEFSDIKRSEISNSSVGWHIKHTLLVFLKIVEFLNNSDPSQFEKKYSFKKLIVFAFGKLPRGKAKAPKLVNPKEVNQSDFISFSSEVQEAIKKLKKTKKNQFVSHHIFGDLNKKDTIRFIEIHTKHHLKIIKEILQKHK